MFAKKNSRIKKMLVSLCMKFHTFAFSSFYDVFYYMLIIWVIFFNYLFVILVLAIKDFKEVKYTSLFHFIFFF